MCVCVCVCKNIQQTDEAFRRYIQKNRECKYIAAASIIITYIERVKFAVVFVREMRLILFEKKDEICRRRVFEIIQPCQHVKVKDYIIRKERTVAYGDLYLFCFS